MTTGATGQLGLALPVQGELSGTWGDTVNNGITQYTNIAIAGTLTLTGDGAVTLANTTGDASASNITSSLSGAGTVTAQFAIVKVSGTTTTKVVTGPSYSKTYVVDNASSFAVTFKASGQTGVSIAAAEKVTVVFNGTDYIKLAGTIANAAGSNTQIQFNNGGLFGASANLTWDGTTLSSTQVNITGQGSLRLQDTTGGEYVGLRSPSALGASYTLTFPADDGTSGQALITDGSGVLSWSTAASGDVYGPASSTDNAVARFDSTTGKLLQNSVVLIGDTGAVTGVTDLTTSGYVKVGTFSAVTGALTSFVSSSGGIYSYYTGGSGYIASYSDNSGTFSPLVFDGSYLAWRPAGTEQMRLTSGLLTVTPGATIQGLTVGRGAGAQTTNTAVGQSTLASNTTGVAATAFGRQALYSNTTAPYNTAVGYQAGYSTTTGRENTVVGAGAFYTNSTGGYNTAIGTDALLSNTTASNNTAVGYQAGYSNTTGASITALGYQALTANTTGNHNTAVGYAAANANTTGLYNSAFGYQSFKLNTTGERNAAIGYEALYSNTTGGYNTALGMWALNANTTASNNTAVGYQAGYSNTTGANNFFGGHQAGYNNTTGSNNLYLGFTSAFYQQTGGNNTAVGHQAFQGNSTPANNTGTGNAAFGQNALLVNSSGASNVAIGKDSLYSSTTASSNTAVGYQAGYTCNDGANTFIGYQSGYSKTTGTGNIYIGYTAGSTSTTGGNNVLIGNTVRASAITNNDELVIASGYNFTGKGSSTGFISPNGGGVYQGNNSSTWSTTSDQRLKKNIVDNNIGLEKLTAIQVRNFEYRIEDEITELPTHCAIKKEGVQLGVIAQELQVVLPECVKTESTGVMSVDTDNLIWYAINAIKELKAENDSLKARLDAANL